MSGKALFLVLTSLVLLTTFVGLIGYLIYHSKITRKQQARFEQYLKQGNASLLQNQERALFKSELQSAGLRSWLHRHYVRIVDVVNAKLVLAYLVFLFFSVFMTLWLGQDWSFWSQSLALVAVNVLAMHFLYQGQVKRLAEAFEQDFPHAVATVSRAVSAGLSLNAALVQAKEQSSGRVQSIFTEICDLQAIGATLEQALTQASIKVPQASFKFFTVCLLLNEQSGGQLAQVLHQLMSNIHERKSHDKKVLAMTAEPRMSAKVIALLPAVFLLFFYYQMPSAFDYLRYHSTGQWIAGYAFVSIVFGLWLINRMTKVD